MELYDCVTCLGPNDAHLLHGFAKNLRENLPGARKLFVITAPEFMQLDPATPPPQFVEFVDERQFPFQREDIDQRFQVPRRSGWYLQQLLKLYAAKQIPELLENFLIVDADVVFHRPVQFFERGRIQFNVGTEHWKPYFVHMARLLPGFSKLRPESGICHLMPMKRAIALDFLRHVETLHSRPAWEAFLDAVDPAYYKHSGASEYELLFTFALKLHPAECEVRPLVWCNSPFPTPEYSGDYEACHHYMRPKKV